MAKLLLAYVMPWINKASLPCTIIYSTHHFEGAGPWGPTRGLEAILRYRLHHCDWSIETYHYRSWEWVNVLDSISVISGTGIDVYTLYWRPCTTCTITLCSYWGYGRVFHFTLSNIVISRVQGMYGIYCPQPLGTASTRKEMLPNAKQQWTGQAVKTMHSKNTETSTKWALENFHSWLSHRNNGAKCDVDRCPESLLKDMDSTQLNKWL